MIFFERFADWLNRPFAEEMDAFGWFLFVGFLVILLMAWGSIIRKVAE